MAPRPELHILLAEDNLMNAEVALMLLAAMGYEDVDVVSSGEGAVAAVERSAYDVVLMDVAMPGTDGLGATQLIRARGDAVHQPAIVAVTANALPGDRERCLQAGMDSYLTKPIVRRELAGVLAQVGNGQLVPSVRKPPPPVAEPTGPDHDEAVVERLVGDYGADAVGRVLELFRGNAATLLEDFTAAVAAGDAAEAGRASHTLKSSARLVGANALADLCERLERSAGDGGLDGVGEGARELRAAVTATLRWLDGVR